MATWAEMEVQSPELAKLGHTLLIKRGRGFLATTRRDGGPRVQAICPAIWDGCLLTGIIKATPKFADLVRDGRFALHAPLPQGDAEFWITGRADRISDNEAGEIMDANPAWHTPVENALFRLNIDTAYGTIFQPGPNNLPLPDRRVFRDSK